MQIVEEKQEASCHLPVRFYTPADLTVTGDFVIRHSGENVFGVSVGIAGGEHRTFVVALPGSGAVETGDGSFTGGLGIYVLEELKRIDGERFLPEATRKS